MIVNSLMQIKTTAFNRPILHHKHTSVIFFTFVKQVTVLILMITKQPIRHYFFINSLIFLLFIIAGCRNDAAVEREKATFVGSKTCMQCHEKEYLDWKNSDHDHSMDSATEKTVSGDFDNAVFVRNGFANRMYKKEGKFYVYTKGKGGKPAEFRVAYTFGYKPLQQYLVPFDSGRLQCLPIAWDSRRKCWFHLSDSLHHGEEIDPGDWLYWTNNGQNWNGMCAECHSTNLHKNYNPETHIYHTTWSEIDVSCEACHGPGSEHNKWASVEKAKRPLIKNYGLVVKTSAITPQQQIDRCAYCHSRRTSYGDFTYPHKNLFDIISPQLPKMPYYYPDGQIKEEDYVYASFMQSKMHENNVRCTDCHDPHTLKPKKSGNDLCLQCHKKEDYDTYKHHRHKYSGEPGKPLLLNGGKKIVAVGEGSQCINCHMPGQYFMGVDFRRDHSMRIPRPDLSDELGTPNACNMCHTDKTAKWAAAYTAKWYRKPQSRFNFGKTMLKAQKGDSAALAGLINLIYNDSVADIVKATAVSYLNNFADKQIDTVIRAMLKSGSALVRREAVKAFVPESDTDLLKVLFPLLDDSVKAVRIEATARLSVTDKNLMGKERFEKYQKRETEYIDALNYSADFAPSRHNLGLLYSNSGNYKEAVKQYKEAIRIDNKFYPSKINLAMVYNISGQNEKAEKLLKDVIKTNPEFPEAYYSLGLLLSEMKRYDESLKYLQIAAVKMPGNSRVQYNLGMMYDFYENDTLAEKHLKNALETEPENYRYINALLKFYLKHNNYTKAYPLAKQTASSGDPESKKLLHFLENKTKQPKP